MIKRRIAILFLLLFSLGFSAQYKTIKGKNVKMSQQEMDRTAAEIVEGFGYFNSKELKQEAIAELRKNFKKEFGTEKNYVEKRVMEMM